MVALPAPGGDLVGALRLDLHAQNGGAAGDDLGKFLGGVQLQPQADAKPIPKGSGELTGSGGGAHQREPGQIQTDGVGAGAFAYNNIDGEIPLPTIISMAKSSMAG